MAAGTIGTGPLSVRKPTASLLQVADHAGGGIEAEGAPAGEHDGVDAVDEVDRIEEVGLARARRRAAHVDATDRAILGEHDGAAGRPLRPACRGRP